MTRARRARAGQSLFVALALLASGGCAREAFAQSGNDAAARALFVEGAKLANQGRWGEALSRYAASLQQRPAPLTRYSLGVAQRETGHLADAIVSFRAFLADAREAATLPYVEPAQAAITELRAQVGILSLTIEPSAIEALTLSIDGQAVSVDPLRDIDPGPHTITARAPGFRETSTRFTARARVTSTLVLLLSPTRFPPAPVEATRPAALAPRPTRPVLPLVLFAGGSGLLLSGAIVGLVAVKQASDAPTRDGPEARSARSRAIAGDVVAGAGLVTLGVGIVLLLTHTKAPPSSAGTPRVSMSDVGVGPSFRF